MQASDYTQLSDIEHILQRPSTYIGAISTVSDTVWLYEEGKVQRKKVEYMPPLEQLLQEASSNCYDNIIRSRKKGVPEGKIVLTINEQEATFYNEGMGIPVERHPDLQVYVPHMIFFMPRTGSNYSTQDQREWVGQNGLGIKIVAIFSSYFEVEVGDPVRGLKYRQISEQNRSLLHPEEITPYEGTQAYVRIKFRPDFPRFECTGFSQAVQGMFAFTALSASFTLKTPITFNNEVFTYHEISKYASLLLPSLGQHIIYRAPDQSVEFCLIDTPEQGFTVSFINHALTKGGGAHVKETLRACTAKLLEKLNKKSRCVDLRDVKRHLSLIINCTVINPVFTTQSKEVFSKPAPKIKIGSEIINLIEQWSFVQYLQRYLDLKQNPPSKEKSSIAHRTLKYKGYEPANNAGKSNCAKKRVLILTEGLSALKFAMMYRSRIPEGSDWYSVFPLKGKGLNTLNADEERVQKNAEISAIKEILNWDQRLDYTLPENRKRLTHDEILVAKDADADGDHIVGLLLLLFDCKLPTLARTGFVKVLLTPIIKATKGVKSKYFLSKEHYAKWYSSLTPQEQGKWEKRYFKGLGGWYESEFKDIGKFLSVEMHYDDLSHERLLLAFDKERSNDRKDWLSSASIPEPQYYRVEGASALYQDVSNFIDTRLILFSHQDNVRSIPCLLDGFKQSQRKIFYASRKKPLGQREIKVAQFMNYTAEVTAYEYGEDNIGGTIAGMCQDFVGSNNIPLLKGMGNVGGTRMNGGRDASHPRYPFVKKEELSEYLFRLEDEILLQKRYDEDREIEPEFYISILPMVAVNGVSGIGTGFSTDCPCFNPLDLVKWVRAWLSEHYPLKDEAPLAYPELVPWYQGFKGKIIPNGNNKNSFTVEGVMEAKGETVQITELPIGVWTNDYTSFLISLVEQKLIKDVLRQNTPREVNYTLIGYKNPTLKKLRLVSSLSCSNIVLFNEEGRLVHYSGIESMLEDFCALRYTYYTQRKRLLLEQAYKNLEEKERRLRFLLDVVEKRLLLVENPRLEEDLAERGYPSSYLSQSLRVITEKGVENVRKEVQALKAQITALEPLSERQIWEQELGEFEQAYSKFSL